MCIVKKQRTREMDIEITQVHFCIICYNKTSRLFNIFSRDYGNSKHTIKDDMIQFFGDVNVERYLRPDDVVCNVCMNIFENFTKLQRRLLPRILNRDSGIDVKPIKFGKVWDIFANYRMDDDEPDSLMNCPSPSTSLLVYSHSKPYRSMLETKIANREHARSISTASSKMSLDKSGPVQKITAKRKRRRKGKGRLWTHRKTRSRNRAASRPATCFSPGSNGSDCSYQSFCESRSHSLYARSRPASNTQPTRAESRSSIQSNSSSFCEFFVPLPDDDPFIYLNRRLSGRISRASSCNSDVTLNREVAETMSQDYRGLKRNRILMMNRKRPTSRASSCNSDVTLNREVAETMRHDYHRELQRKRMLMLSRKRPTSRASSCNSDVTLNREVAETMRQDYHRELQRKFTLNRKRKAPSVMSETSREIAGVLKQRGSRKPRSRTECRSRSPLNDTNSVSSFKSIIRPQSAKMKKFSNRRTDSACTVLKYDNGKLLNKRTRSVSRAQELEAQTIAEEEIRDGLKCSWPGCVKSCETIDDLTEHKKSEHHMVASFKCDVGCDNRYVSVKDRLIHRIFVHEDEIHSCSMCDRFFEGISSLQQHVDCHLQYSVPCLYCDKYFLDKKQLGDHVREDHKGKKKRVRSRIQSIIDRIDKIGSDEESVQSKTPSPLPYPEKDFSVRISIQQPRPEGEREKETDYLFKKFSEKFRTLSRQQKTQESEGTDGSVCAAGSEPFVSIENQPTTNTRDTDDNT